MYFTENSFDADTDQIIFMSDRASGIGKAPHEEPHYNLFSMDLTGGEIVQLTDEPESVSVPGSVTKTPDGRIVVYKTGNTYQEAGSPDRRDHCALSGNGPLHARRTVDQP